MAYGICKMCGCTDVDPCYHPDHGTCWWVDETHELCSHCADESIAKDERTRHCVNSTGFDPFPGVMNKYFASLGCPYPDEDCDACCDCSHFISFSRECDLGIGLP